MSKFIDLTGQKFGYWTVIKRDTDSSKSGTRWICKCVCGVEKSVVGSTLKNGKSTNCGCIAKENLRKNNTLDLTGQKFGRLTVIKMVESIKTKDGKFKSQCLCECECGNIIKVKSQALKSGNTKSCGCLKIEKSQRFEDLTGKRFGKLNVMKYSHKEYNKKLHNHIFYYLCKCDCGNEIIKSDRYLKYTKTPSCGCYGLKKIKEVNKKAHTTHGMRNSRIYRIWQSMKSRCKYKSVNGYENYGGRGIKVCDEWLNDFISFYNWAMKNGYKEDLTIDRIDVDGNYEPDNCRWATLKEQSNNRRDNHYITYNNETHSISEWSEILKINYATLLNRITRHKWSIERAFAEPVHEEKRRC